MTRYRLSNRETIVHAGQFLPSGSEVPAEILSKMGKKNIDDHVRNGLLVVIGSDRDNAAKDVGVDPGVAPIKTEITDNGRVLMVNDPKSKKAPQKGLWSYDPKALKKASLEDLNLLVAGIDHKVEPFTTTEEAIAQLSMDFRG